MQQDPNVQGPQSGMVPESQGLVSQGKYREHGPQKTKPPVEELATDSQRVDLQGQYDNSYKDRT